MKKIKFTESQIIKALKENEQGRKKVEETDPEVWVSIYGYAALMSALAAFRWYPIPLLLIGAGFALIGGIYFFSASVQEWVIQKLEQQNLSMKTLDMEEARESFGLLIVCFALSLAGYISWQRKRNIRALKMSA
jgi:hypothetical protein